MGKFLKVMGTISRCKQYNKTSCETTINGLIYN